MFCPFSSRKYRLLIVHRIYDEESDRHVHISFLDALKATCYGHEKGPVGDLFDLANLDTDKLSKEEVSAWNTLGVAARDAADLDTASAAARAIVKKIQDALDAKQWVPVEIVIARPFIEHMMLSAIVTVAGRDTGATLFGPADMQLSVRVLQLNARVPLIRVRLGGVLSLTVGCLVTG